MKLLALLRPPQGSDVREALAAHAHQELLALWELYSEDWVREMYLPGGPGAVLVLEADSREAATERLRRLPLVSDHVMELELIELQPFRPIQLLFA